MKHCLFFLVFAIITVQNLYGQEITLDCDLYLDIDSDGLTIDEAMFLMPFVNIESTHLTLSPMDDSGWRFDFIDKDVADIEFPIEKTKIDISESGCLTLSALLSDGGEKKIRLFHDYDAESIEMDISIKEDPIQTFVRAIDGQFFPKNVYNIKLPTGMSFNDLVWLISSPYIKKSATYDNSLIGLINNPLGIDWGDSWRMSFYEIYNVSKCFYGENYSSSYHGYDLHYYPNSKSNKQLYICSQKVNAITVESVWHEGKMCIKSTSYGIYLKTSKSFKKDPYVEKKEECIWNKKMAIEYCNKIKHELDLLGCGMQKVKSKYICRYEGMKNGKIITLELIKIRSKYSDFFSVSLDISHKT